MIPASEKIRVAVLGCGQIADAHLSQIQRIKSAEVVAVCDMHLDLAWQAARRFQVPRFETGFTRMVEEARPDVVHLTTPAQTHAPLAIELLQAGCHVFVEKPFTLDARAARDVLAVAAANGKLVCVGHDQLYDPAWLTCKKWVLQGLIGEVRHIESILGYPIDGKFGAQVSGNPQHWVRRLPGGLFQNTISHPLYRITDLMNDVQPEIMGGWRTRPGMNFPTEMSISLQGRNQSGSLTFSTFLPPQRMTRVYGTTGMIDIDFDTQTLRLNPLTKLPGAFAKLEAPWRQVRNSLWNLGNNFWRFGRSDIHYFAGMKHLFQAFYDSIQHGGSPPIAPDEIERVTYLMDRIFDHCRKQELQTCRTEDTESIQFPGPKAEVSACL